MNEIIAKKESENIEFKKSVGEWKEIVETVSAFSNTSGGKILVGISNSGKIIGVKIGKDTIEDLTNKIVSNTDPKVYPKISVEEIEKKKIIVIEVKESADKLVLAFGRPYKRIGRSTIKMSKDEYEKLVLEKHREELRFDKQFCKGASLKDIDEEKVKWFLREAKREHGLKIEEKTPVAEILTKLKLITIGKLTNSAILLFGGNPQEYISQAETRCARFKGTKAVKPFIDMKVFGGSIVDQVDKALGFVLEHTPMAAWLEEGKVQRKEKYEYPPEAIREAIVNAICHRDYSSSANVQIRIFDDRIEVWNPGKLPEGWTVEKLKEVHESIPKNPLIADQFFLIKFIEKWGTGTTDMIKQCLDWGLPEPNFEYTGTSLVVTFWKSKLTEEYLKSLGLNERQRKAIEYAKEKGSITRSEYTTINNVSSKTAYLELIELLKKKLFIQEGKGRATKYSVKR